MSLKLIADSGSTKTHWLIKNESEIIREFYTQGVNPYFVSTDDLIEILVSNTSTEERNAIAQIQFYGAGCSGDEKCSIIKSAFVKLFANANIEVNSDLLGSAIALYPIGSGVVCILGTGSNAAVFVDGAFEDSISSLGYVLGDQGSGSYLGKTLIADYFQNKMSEELRTKFSEKFEIDYQQVLNSVYKQSYPNRYLAQFTIFLSENRGETYVEELLRASFQTFVDSQLSTLNFDKSILKVGFVGSIAFYFKDILMFVLEENGYMVSTIIKEPMEGLV